MTLYLTRKILYINQKKTLNVVLFTIEDPFYFPKFIKELIAKENIQLSLVVFPKGFFSLKKVFIISFIFY